jgi:quercetin dioxygenase-like cupin family protein
MSWKTALPLFALATLAVAQTPAPKEKPAAAPHRKHVAVAADQVKFAPAPPAAGLPAGSEMAVLYGDPGKPGFFTVRLKLKDGVKINPHYHPTDEHITVLKGTFMAGMGDTFDEPKMMSFAPGAYLMMPKIMHHYAMSKGESIIQLSAIGPFGITYLNPADDPRKVAGTQ